MRCVLLATVIVGTFPLPAFAQFPEKSGALAISVHPSAWTIAGALVGGLIAILSTWFFDWLRRRRELREMKASIYAEIADRSARCVSDYIHPWKNFDKATPLEKSFDAEWFGKFRPTDPVAYPALVAKIGLLDAKTLLALTHFYFRLDALCRAFDSVTANFERGINLAKADPGRFHLIKVRMQSTFGPALRAIDRLNAHEKVEIDREVKIEYRHLRTSGLTLREALKKYSVPDDVISGREAEPAANESG